MFLLSRYGNYIILLTSRHNLLKIASVKKPNPEQSGDGKPWVPTFKGPDRQVAMEKMIISRSIDPSGLFQLTIAPRQAFLPPALSSEHHSRKTQCWSFAVLGKETTVNERLGDHAMHCCACNAKIEEDECYDFDDMILICRQGRYRASKNPDIFITSIQRFLIGNVIWRCHETKTQREPIHL